MIKKILLACLLLFTFVNTVSAHTGLESSFPKDGQVVTEQVQEIILNFNTKIEQGSTYELKAVDGLDIPIASITLDENQMKGTIQQPLKNGEYIVLWDIIGADGHPIQGEYTFFVEMPNEEKKEEPVEDEDKDKELNGGTSSPPTTSNELPQTENQQSFTISILIIMLVIMSLIIVGTFFIIFKRKN